MSHAPVDPSEHLAATHAAAAPMRGAAHTSSNRSAQPSRESIESMLIGSMFAIADVYRLDTRTRWQRFRDFILRRPAPKARLQTFKVTEMVGAPINVKRPQPYIQRQHKDRYL